MECSTLCFLCLKCLYSTELSTFTNSLGSWTAEWVPSAVKAVSCQNGMQTVLPLSIVSLQHWIVHELFEIVKSRMGAVSRLLFKIKLECRLCLLSTALDCSRIHWVREECKGCRQRLVTVDNELPIMRMNAVNACFISSRMFTNSLSHYSWRTIWVGVPLAVGG